MRRGHSWGRYPGQAQSLQNLHWCEQAEAALQQRREAAQLTLGYGQGRSYGDVCLSAGESLLHTGGLDRFISADWTRGILRAEAGVTLDQILRLCVPRGWFLPVTPGTRFVSLGGAIANDVHGKNHHHKGSFGCHLRALGLLRSDQGALHCSARQHAELFQASIGGLGLTGLIAWAEIQLEPISGSSLAVTTQRFGRLDEAFALSQALDAIHQYAVAWVDCSAPRNQLGRGYYQVADFLDQGELTPPAKPRWNLPISPPFSLINRSSVRLFNAWHWQRQPRQPDRRSMHFDAFFYPLDAIMHWNRLYGSAGFQQYQCVIPQAEAQEALQAMLQRIRQHRCGSSLAVLKRLGERASPGLLSFPMPGMTLALDFPNHQLADSRLFAELDSIVREAGGRLYPAKDAHMLAADFQRSYPQWTRLEALRDPQLLSKFWKRVTMQ